MVSAERMTNVVKAIAAHRKAHAALLIIALVAFTTGCDLIGLGGGGGAQVAGVATVRPRPTRVPTTPTPAVSPEPTATATPAPNLSLIDVQRIVFQRIAQCADEVSEAKGAQVQVTVNAAYDVAELAWSAEATGNDDTLTFGLWLVDDASGAVAPDDEIAGTVARSGIDCAEPVAMLKRGATPPLFVTSTPTPTATPSPTATPTELPPLPHSHRLW